MSETLVCAGSSEPSDDGSSMTVGDDVEMIDKAIMSLNTCIQSIIAGGIHSCMMHSHVFVLKYVRNWN